MLNLIFSPLNFQFKSYSVHAFHFRDGNTQKMENSLILLKMRTSLSISKTKITVLGLSDFQVRSRLQIADTSDVSFS